MKNTKPSKSFPSIHYNGNYTMTSEQTPPMDKPAFTEEELDALREKRSKTFFPGPYESTLTKEDGDERWIITTANGGFHIATVENGQPGDTLDTEANTAKLLASAPDLYEALALLTPYAEFASEQMYDGTQGHQQRETAKQRLEKARAALSKANPRRKEEGR